MATVATKQFKLMLDEQVASRLDALAQEYHRDSGNKVAIEIITLYTDAWERAERARFAVIHEQTGSAGTIRVPVVDLRNHEGPKKTQETESDRGTRRANPSVMQKRRKTL